MVKLKSNSQEIKNIVIGILLLITLMICCYLIGVSHHQKLIEKRAQEIGIDCINEYELEYIIFGESQE